MDSALEGSKTVTEQIKDLVGITAELEEIAEEDKKKLNNLIRDNIISRLKAALPPEVLIVGWEYGDKGKVKIEFDSTGRTLERYKRDQDFYPDNLYADLMKIPQMKGLADEIKKEYGLSFTPGFFAELDQQC